MINSFTGKYRFLSNFYPCLIVDDMTLSYLTLEANIIILFRLVIGSNPIWSFYKYVKLRIVFNSQI